MFDNLPDSQAGNVVTFMTFLGDGRLVAQQRGFITPDGKPVSNAGLFSINGGKMETADIMTELYREIEEELGIPAEFTAGEINYLGDVEDTAQSRTNHVFTFDNYDGCLWEYLNSIKEPNHRHTEQGPLHAGMDIVFETEGLGRVFFNPANFQAALDQQRFTPISVAIFEKFPKNGPWFS